MKKTLCLLLAVSGFISADEIQNDLPLVFSEDFEKGFQRRELTDPKGWTHSSPPFLPHGFRPTRVSATFPPKENS
ncbi:MAG: hypothetical protein P8Q54_04485 [Akkermansiaceae bacterium]|nr:hypothetical protein [Akkermansiaceae bacterium]MDG1362712.1 hypothetical protein [Akkermansiaceae bacterium]